MGGLRAVVYPPKIKKRPAGKFAKKVFRKKPAVKS